MLERNEEALKVYKKLLRKGVQSVAYDDCGEGIRAARRLLNDCRYRIGLIYARTGNINLAKKYIQEHIDHRNSNTPSIYGLKEVKKKLFTITR